MYVVSHYTMQVAIVKATKCPSSKKVRQGHNYQNLMLNFFLYYQVYIAQVVRLIQHRKKMIVIFLKETCRAAVSGFFRIRKYPPKCIYACMCN